MNVTRAGVDGSSAPNTASNLGSYCIIIGAGVDGSSAPDTASKCIGLREPKGY